MRRGLEPRQVPFKPMKRSAAGLVLAAVVAGCGDDAESFDERDERCVSVPDYAADAIASASASGVQPQFDGWAMIETGPLADSGYRHLVIAEVSNIEDPGLGVWAMGGVTVGDTGPIDAINRPAMASTDWGSAARPGSPASDLRHEIADSVWFKRVLTCALPA